MNAGAANAFTPFPEKDQSMSSPANRPSLDDIRTLPIAAIAALSGVHLALLREEAEAALSAARALKEWLDGAIALRYGDRAGALRREQGKDTGTVRFEDGDVVVVADLVKKVDWDQAKLASLASLIVESGDNPADYLDVSYRVPERKYAA